MQVLEVRPATFLYNPALAEGTKVTLHVIKSARTWKPEFEFHLQRELQLREWNLRLPKLRRWTWVGTGNNLVILALPDQRDQA